MDKMNLDYISVFALMPSKNAQIEPDDLPGGILEIDEEIRRIFTASFNGELPKSLKFQPFHFQFDGNSRENSTRQGLIRFLSTRNVSERTSIAREYAFNLAKLIDHRTGQLLFAFAYGDNQNRRRIVLSAYPHDEPIQYRTIKGIPSVYEIKNAFSQSSNLRKAVYFEVGCESIGRNDLLTGTLVDSSAGRGYPSANYWLSEFLKGKMDILPVRGTNQVLSGLKAAQKKAATVEEKNSVKAAFYAIMSGRKSDATINEIGSLLVGEARNAYMKAIPKSIENDARFDVDLDEVKKKIRNTIFVLKSGIEVHFPSESTVDAEDYIKTVDGTRFLTISEEIDEEIFG